MGASELASRRCRACKGEVDRVDPKTARVILADLPGWEMNATASEIHREVKLANYHEVIAFVNAIAWIAHQEDHHPDLEVHYGRVMVRYSTHSVGGLSDNDFICAAKVDRLLRLVED